jgi:hypothetical protein
MRTLLLAAPGDSGHGVVARRVRLRDLLAARWRAGSLERALARGVAPDTDAALALRAEALIGPSVRAALARRLRRVVRDARATGVLFSTRVPTRGRAILAAAEDLDRLAGRLVAPRPVSARGVARVRLLLSDGCGPLYFRGAAEELQVAVSRALADLEVHVER